MKKFKVLLLVFLGYVPTLFAQRPMALLADTAMVKVLFFAGLRDKLNEDYSRANESFNKILQLDVKNAAVYYEIAIVNYRQNNLYEAEMAIKKATALEANNTWYWMLMAELYKRKGDMNAMAGVLNQLIRLSPDKRDYYFDRSNAYLMAGKIPEAMKGYDELEKKFGPSDELTRARRRVVSGGPVNISGEEGRKHDDGKSGVEPAVAEQGMQLAESLYKKGDLNGALAQFKLVLQGDEHPYRAWEQALNIQLLLKQYKDAIKTADAALAIYPNQAILYYFMALALHQDHQYDLALTNVKSALELDADNGIYLELYGDVLFVRGDTALALVQWKKAKAAGNGSEKLTRKINERKYLE
ncbi:MAG: tetratricopeptide repeat protein [Candidatus Pedobacter colombiensis]|uniref:Tetratricopeptide repeat protein n=1 Tax=Candidatus Pedobacter colombiensis TaxID=3121371 RepID=A0AAJ6B921_9SPHI|nr:tetratricopeptide repeat protein [Pedobacter sp.]WEK19728.1 MAG: tetratricopeptide repeat protein [Pedobacter sp.]